MDEGASANDAILDELIVKAGHQASQDFDAWVLKLGTAGLTLALGVAALVETEFLGNLVWAGSLFAGSLIAGLLSLRLSTDGLRKRAEEIRRATDAKEPWQFTWVTFFNWVAFLTLSAAFVMLAVFLGLDAIPKTEGG